FFSSNVKGFISSLLEVFSLSYDSFSFFNLSKSSIIKFFSSLLKLGKISIISSNLCLSDNDISSYTLERRDISSSVNMRSFFISLFSSSLLLSVLTTVSLLLLSFLSILSVLLHEISAKDNKHTSITFFNEFLCFNYTPPINKLSFLLYNDNNDL